jgi:NSS family neurotransmitter:Na+ symporter
VAIVVALTVFSLVFSIGSDPGAGVSLLFDNLPYAISKMPFGEVVGGLFFLLALFAALASSISLMEVAVSWLDERPGVTRWGAALGTGFVVFVIGGGYILSREYILFVDFIAASLLMPLGGFLMAIFAGWVIEKKLMEAEFGAPFFRVWRPIVRWLIPIAIGIVLVLGAWYKLRPVGG